MTDVAARDRVVVSRIWTPTQWVVVGVSCLAGVGLRWVGLGASLPSFDETFTGMAARLPLGEIPGYLRTADSHPPFDYLVRHFFAGSGDVAALRLPSAVAGTATLLVVVWWMRNRAWFGVFVVALTSVAAVQVLYARQARMYAFVILAGTIVAVASERWLGRPRERWAAVAAAALTVALFSHTTGVLLALGTLMVPGLSRGRDAWWWRVTVAVPLAVWAALWGTSFAHQLAHDPASWIPYSSPRTAAEAVAGQVSMYDGLAVFVLAVVVLGGVRLVGREQALGRVWLCLFVAPSVAVVLLGIDHHLLLPRSLAFAAWGPVVAVAAVASACVEDRPSWLTPPIGVLGIVVCAVLVVPSAFSAATYEEDSAAVRRHVVELAQPGDALAVYPRFLAPMLEWDNGVPRDAAAVEALAGEDDLWSATSPGAPPTGRLWLVVPDTYAYRPPPTYTPCAPPAVWHDGDYVLSCYVAASAAPPG